MAILLKKFKFQYDNTLSHTSSAFSPSVVVFKFQYDNTLSLSQSPVILSHRPI